jgi:hypothetical protein
MSEGKVLPFERRPHIQPVPQADGDSNSGLWAPDEMRVLREDYIEAKEEIAWLRKRVSELTAQLLRRELE